MVQAMNGTVDEVIRVAEAQGIDADIRRTDELMVATNPAQLGRARGRGRPPPALGRGRGPRLPDRRRRLAGPRPHPRQHRRHGRDRRRAGPACQTGARPWRPLSNARASRSPRARPPPPSRPAASPRPTARSARPIILRATEGFTTTLPGLEREWLPLNSAQIATEPLPPEVWDQIGWSGPRDPRRHGQRLLLLPAHARRAHHRRRARHALPDGFRAWIIAARPMPRPSRRLTAILHRHFPADEALPHRPRLVRRAWRSARLVRDRRPGPRHRYRLGGRLCRCRRLYLEPRGPHARRPRAQPRHRPDPPALGRPPPPAMGAGAAALARRHRHVRAAERSRPQRDGLERPALAPWPPRATGSPGDELLSGSVFRL